MGIESTDGGKINVANLTDLNAVNLVFDSTNNLNTPTSQFVKFTNGSITADGVTPDLSGLVNIDDSNLYANNGGVIDLSQILSYLSSGDTFIQADGTGSK